MAYAVAGYLREYSLAPDANATFPSAKFRDAERFLGTVCDELTVGNIPMKTPASGSRMANSMFAMRSFMNVFPKPARQDGELFAGTMEIYLNYIRVALKDPKAVTNFPAGQLLGMYVFFHELWRIGEDLLERERHSSTSPSR